MTPRANQTRNPCARLARAIAGRLPVAAQPISPGVFAELDDDTKQMLFDVVHDAHALGLRVEDALAARPWDNCQKRALRRLETILETARQTARDMLMDERNAHAGDAGERG